MSIRLTNAQAHAAGIQLPARKRQRAKAAAVGHSVFIAACAAHGLPEPVPEYPFASPDRGWRFDWAWLDTEDYDRVALEIQGGIWTGGRHVRGAALLDEMEKLNEAALRHWRVLYATPADVQSGAVFELLKRALS